MNKRLKLAVAVVAVLAVVGLAIWFLRPPSRPCETGEYSRLVGVGVDVQLEQMKALQGKLGLSDSLVRGLDMTLRDYSAKYDNACRDVTQDLITVQQYQCMRQQMDRSLDFVRRVTQALEAARSGSDVDSQRKILQGALDELQRARDEGFGGGCIPGLDVTPKQVLFKGNSTVGFFTLANRGQLPLTFSIAEYPRGFMPRKITGTVAPSDDVDVVVTRTPDELPPKRPFQAVIKVGSRADLPVEFVVDEQNAQLWENLGSRLRDSIAADPSVAGAVAVIDSTIPAGVEIAAGERQALAATALFAAGFPSQAQAALQQALDTDKRLAESPSVLKLAALLAAERPEAQKLYMAVREAQPTFEQTIGAQGTTVGVTSLGKVQLNQHVATANGQFLVPGTYDMRLKKAGAIDGLKANWIEFLQNNEVKGREVAAEVPQGMAGVKPGPHFQKTERRDSTNLWLAAGDTNYVVNMSSCATPQKCSG